MLRTGRWPSASSTVETASTTIAYHSGACGGRVGAEPGNRTADRAMTTVSQLSQEKLPDAISHSWVTIIRTAAQVATGCGVNSRNGTTSWVTWLAAVSTRCSGR